MSMASPVKYPPAGPITCLAKLYPPPAAGIDADISANDKTKQKYIIAIKPAAIANPPQPACAIPKFHPAKSPEIT